MLRWSLLLLFTVLLLAEVGCASSPRCWCEGETAKKEKNGVDQKGAKTLLEWTGGKKNEDGKEPQNKQADEDKAGNGSSKAQEPEEPKRLEPDRPHLPEASSTVGLGRVVLESGYTFSQKDSSFQSHSYPETLLRIGMFAEWLEFRIAQNFLTQRSAPAQLSETGAQDLTLGVKLALTEQKGCLPAMALIPQTTVPSGSKGLSANEVLPGFNLDLGWEDDAKRFGLEALLAVNGAVDDARHTFVLVDHGLTLSYNATKKLEAFIEWDAFYAAGAVGPKTGPQHYIVGGCVYFFTNNFEMDLRAGVGLNEHANDFLVGPGFAVRY